MRSLAARAWLIPLALAGSAVAQPTEVFDVPYGTHPLQRLDFYFSPAGLPPAPLVVLVHGGGWWRGDKATDAPAVEARRLRDKLGFATASINYRLTALPPPRLGDPMPAQVEDVRDAVAFLVDRADTYRFDPDRVFLWGISAGGHLAAMAALQYGMDVRGVVDLFGPTALGEREVAGELAWDADLAAAGCPAYADCNPGIPPEEKPCFLGQADARSNTSALAGCDAGDPACLPAIDAASPDLPGNWAAEPPPFLIIHHGSDCRVPVRQSERLYAALGTARATLHLGRGDHYLTEEDQAVVDLFLTAHAD
jgi:acetyl esterase/lipase